MADIPYLLFDLDGTLLHFDVNQFTERYLSLIKNHFREVRESQHIPAWILQGTALMLQNNGQRLNADIFLEYFSAHCGLPTAMVWQRFLHFYQTDFKTLNVLTRQVADAAMLLEKALTAGYKLVLATQPIFPLLAIRQRLHWAALDGIPWDLITHIENMHACKPSPIYFAEILDLLHIQPEQCLMIGNEFETDMASKEIGIKTFFLTDHQPVIHQRDADYAGNLTDLACFLKLK
jgi:FMN phosphatase YigB (HAD superfamily)